MFDSRQVLATYLSANAPLTKEEIATICHHFQPEVLNREDALMKQGDRFRKIVFVAEGILRVFVLDTEGEEVVKNFIEANDFFSDIGSFEKNLPSGLNVSAITNCNLLTLSKADAEILVSKLPSWEYWMKAGAMQAMNEMIRKQGFLRIGDATSQYRHFVEHFPSLAQQVPLKYIASYLRVTQSSLSRIRKQGW
jgi:CRP-like cAMP-binding protein